MADSVEPSFEVLLEYLKSTRGFDFTGYKRSSLMRRAQKRMSQIPLESFSEYMDFLEAHPDEFEQLFNTILINVTGFFRDEDTWEYLTKEIVPRLLQKSGAHAPIRIWCAGCASGEEAYSLAMVLCEAMGISSFRERVKIYATDVDDEALSQARAASYPAKQLESVPEHLQVKYFNRQGNNFVFSPELRRSVIFGRHDLVQDPPISRLDLLTCRNTLMYLNADTQAKILARFNFGLKEDGFLLLGKAEMLLSHNHLFNQVGLDYRVFTKVSQPGGREKTSSLTADQIDSESLANYALKEAAFNKALLAQIMIDRESVVVAANERARTAFGIKSTDIGRPFQDLEVSFRPLELRSLIEQAYGENRMIRAPKVQHLNGYGEQLQYEIEVSPLCQPVFKQVGALISFHDRTTYHVLYNSLQAAHLELETTNEELQSTNEELETTNEELQSTNEELETTNEELQSANEELETTNEELQSTNEELASINSDLQVLSDAADSTSVFLQQILAGMPYGVVVLNDRLEVVVWSRMSEDMWGLRSDEVLGREFVSLDIGLPLKELEPELRNVIKSSLRLVKEVAARNRRGKQTRCQVEVSALSRSTQISAGLVVQMTEVTSAG